MTSPRTIEPGKGDPEVLRAVGFGRRRRSLRFLLAVVIPLAIVAAVLFYKLKKPAAQTTQYQFERVERGDLTVSVTATGTLKARSTVEVGAEITGRVLRVFVNFNDRVTAGQVLAEIDTEQFQAKVDEATAQLSSANASLLNAKASADENKQKLERARSMAQQGLVAAQDLEAAEANAKRASAQVASASSQVTIAQASLKVSKTNLSKAVIRSPIDGVVLNRAVEPGQTVTSGLQTPVLFVLAADLSALQLNVQVDEADVGAVHEEQEASFSVDAYAQQTFPSKVLAVKNMPTSGTSVVTYESWLSVDNTKRLLRPGMTATSTIVVDKRKDALLVSNAALRFNPFRRAQAAQSSQTKSSFSQLLPTNRRPPGMGNKSSSNGNGGGPRKPALWVLDKEKNEPKRIEIEVGPSDGIRTEVRSTEIQEGMEILVGMTEASRG